MKSILFTPSATRQWIKLAAQTHKRIDARLTAYAGTGAGDVKRLKGRAGARLRVGDWRVIFDESDKGIVVVAVGHRREIND
ncbi:MAG: type II toxin-antitoxin system RelE/ParE family toxin [Bauldia sp.]